MELLDRYLQAVRFWLPKSHQDDIIAELRSNIQGQMEDREAELGHALSLDEQGAVLKSHGRPVLVASQYGRRRHLIGPALFPMYALTIKASLGVALAIYFVVAVILVVTSGTDLVEQALHFPSVALTVFGWVTLVFAGLEMGISSCRVAGRWDPRSLPQVRRRAPGREKPVPRTTAFAELVVGTAACIWGLSALRSPHRPLVRARK